MSDVLSAWVADLSRELEVDPPVDIRLLLDVARDAAHNVDRPAAPLTTFVLGYAAALSGGDAEAVRRAAAVASRMALERGTPGGDPATPGEAAGRVADADAE